MLSVYYIRPKISSNIKIFENLLKIFKKNIKRNNMGYLIFFTILFFILLGCNSIISYISIKTNWIDFYQHGISFTNYLSHNSAEFFVFNNKLNLNKLIESVKRTNDFNFIAFTDYNHRLIAHSNYERMEKYIFFNPLSNEEAVYIYSDTVVKKGIDEFYNPFLLFIKDVMYKKQKIGHIYFSLYLSKFYKKIEHIENKFLNYKTRILYISSIIFLFIWLNLYIEHHNSKKEYKNITKINEGGICDIFLAEYAINNVFEKNVILKKLKSDLINQSYLNSRLINEGKLVKKCQDPNIVKVYGFDFNQKAIVMEYLKGVNLDVFLDKTNGNLPIHAAFYILLEICKPLKYLHQNKIVHLDIKPKNIVVLYNGIIKLIDFGIAKTVDELRKAFIYPSEGTLNYMSPEQIYGEPLDQSSDVYSFGMLAYKLITGKKLYTFSNKQDAIQKLNKTNIFFNNSNIPKRLRYIISKCIVRDKIWRYKNAIELYNDLYQLKNNNISFIQYDESCFKKYIEKLF